jgi:predicted DNA binding CopG/RHH family protein
MAKKVSFATKPAPKMTDEWVENRTEETIKRFTIDIPESLHRRMKTQCAARGLKMNAVNREMLEEKFPA